MNRINAKERARGVWRKLSSLDARPDQIASGFAIGVFAGLLPLNPSPILVATAVAWVLKRNVAAAVAGAVASMLYLPLLPFIWLAEYRLGTFIVPVRHPLSVEHARLWEVLQKGFDVYGAMCVGSIIIGIPVSWLTYFIVKRIAEKWARQHVASQRSA